MDVDVRELKEQLSEYLDRAARGEVIRVTDRGVPKAILGPAPGMSRLEVGIREGWIRAGSDAPIKPVAAQRSPLTIADVLADDRGD
ncbi:MAG: type II toxin-antitoxin system prevent-host-death family antitoxin [Myxococcales bacterium]|nr:type II toxin-antitoxin system prevent-host-death family antitoxin [Myxococcales bacterium]